MWDRRRNPLLSQVLFDEAYIGAYEDIVAMRRNPLLSQVLFDQDCGGLLCIWRGLGRNPLLSQVLFDTITLEDNIKLSS